MVKPFLCSSTSSRKSQFIKPGPVNNLIKYLILPRNLPKVLLIPPADIRKAASVEEILRN